MSLDTKDLRISRDTPVGSRRQFLKQGATGLGLLGMPVVNRRYAPSGSPVSEKSVILILMVGGPSQLETWDPKPLASSDIRGPFESIATRVPGVRISEHLPRLAAKMDRLALVRSMYHESAPIHETGLQLLQTGRICRPGDDYPHLGSVLAHLNNPMTAQPGFAIIPGPIAFTGIDLPHGQSAGWLDARSAYHNPKATASRVRDDYGTSAIGESLFLARQLVCSGVTSVTVNAFGTVFNRPSWDCHGSSPFSTLEDYATSLLPQFDRAVSTLIDDLDCQGRLDSTLIVAAGEFGRSPRCNAAGGRDHWPAAWSVMLAGGGIRGGTVVGATDAQASSPTDQPVTPIDLLATIYQSQGISPSTELLRPDGRPFRLVENGRVIAGLLG